MKHFFLPILAWTIAASASPISLMSPDRRITANIQSGDSLMYSISMDGRLVMQPSTIGLKLTDGENIGYGNTKVVSRRNVDEKVTTPFYRHTSVPDRYNELTLRLSKDWDVIFRAYDDGVAYRFVTRRKKPFTIKEETARFRFPSDAKAWAPYANVATGSTFEQQFNNSFENTYHTAPLDSLDCRRLIFLPMAVEPDSAVKVLLTESALENYPGMFVNTSAAPGTLNAVFAPRPSKRHQGGHNNLQMLVDEREDYIAAIDGPRAFPWRIAVVADNDSTLAATNLSYLLGEPSRLEDISWIKPGKVAWDWWNDWNLRGVDFKTGVNNDTYKAYIDFASRNGIEYVILDEGGLSTERLTL